MGDWENLRHKKYFQNKEKIYISLFGINTIEDFKNNLYISFILKFKKFEKELINNIIVNTNIPLFAEEINIDSSISLRIFKENIKKVCTESKILDNIN